MLIQNDYSNFDPAKSGTGDFYIPAEGDYMMTLVAVAPKESDAFGGVAVEMELLIDGDGETFTQLFMINHPTPKVREIAYDTIGRIYYAVTGSKPPMQFDLSPLVNGRLAASIKHSHKEKDGTMRTYAGLRNILPIAGEQQAVAPVAQQPTQPAPQQTSPQAGASTYGVPSWG